MKKITSAFHEKGGFTTLPASRLAGLIDSYLLACDIARHSPRTIESRRERLSRLTWLAQREAWETASLLEMRRFFHYLNHGHKEPGGRWDNPTQTKPLSSGRVKTYHASLRAFFAWLIREDEIAASPMVRIPPPVDRPDQIQPFSPEQVRALLAAARKTGSPLRDEAMLLLLIDTGLRVSELVSLKVSDVSLDGVMNLF